MSIIMLFVIAILKRAPLLHPVTLPEEEEPSTFYGAGVVEHSITQVTKQEEQKNPFQRVISLNKENGLNVPEPLRAPRTADVMELSIIT